MRAGSSVFLEEAIGSEGQHLRSSDRANEGKANGTAALSAKRKACVAPQRSHVHQPVRAMFHAVDSAFWNTVAGPVVSISHLTSAARAVLNCLRTALSRSAFACLAGVGLRFIAHVLPARSTPISRDPLRPSGCSHSSIARVPAGLLVTIQRQYSKSGSSEICSTSWSSRNTECSPQCGHTGKRSPFRIQRSSFEQSPWASR